MKNFTFLTDGDIVAYRSASVCEEEWFMVFSEFGVAEIKGKKNLKLLGDVEHQVFYKVSPDFAPMGTVKRTIEKINGMGGCKDNKIFLSPGTKDTFRYRLGKTVEYKGNRVNLRRPHHLNTCRDYLVHYKGATIADDVEADDMLGIHQCKDLYRNGYMCQQHEANTAICSIDKDLRMIPGWHVNWVKGTTEWITEWGYLKLSAGKLTGGGMKWFYAQLLMGDTTDNIIGPKGIGDTKAFKVLDKIDNNEQAEQVVFGEYEKAFGNDAYDRITENGRLLWILRDPIQKVDLWKPEYL